MAYANAKVGQGSPCVCAHVHVSVRVKTVHVQRQVKVCSGIGIILCFAKDNAFGC